MNELPVFVSYRRVDGTNVAKWLYDSLDGRTIWLKSDTSLSYPATLSVYFDRTMPANPDWKSLQGTELELARALLLVCSPKAMSEYPDRDDEFYREIRWWLENRSNIAPILVTQLDEHCIPSIVKSRWPNSQVIKVDLDAWTKLLPVEGESESEKSVDSIRAGISAIVGGSSEDSSLLMTPFPDGMSSPNLPNHYAWMKDKRLHYIYCNEAYASAAGHDSPHAMMGKTDDDMAWRSLAEFFRAGDRQVMSGKGSPRMNVQETEIMVDRVADILVTERPLLNHRQQSIGVVGSFVDITGCELRPRPIVLTDEGKKYHLGGEYGDEYLSAIEGEVMKGILNLYSAERIAGSLNISRAAVESFTQSIRRKFQCPTDGDIVAAAIKSGIPLKLFGPNIVSGPDIGRIK